MNLDDLLALTAQQIPTQLDEARARRTAGHIEREYAERLAANVDISSDVDLRDPAAMAENKRILRSAELLKLGTISWFRTGPRIDWSAEMSRILGHAPGEVPPSLSRLVSMIHPKDRATVRRQFRAAWRDEEEKEVGFRVVKPDGVTAYVHCSIEVVTEDGEATGIIATGQDVTVVEKARQERARRVLRGGTVQEDLIELDPVTGLLTRRRFADEVGRALRTGTGTLLVVSAPPYIRRSTDADSGRDDRLSAAAAEVIRSVVGPADACGVLGRHEFGVLLPYTTVDTAKSRADEILNRLRATRYLAATSRLDAFGGLVHYDYRMPIESIELLFDAETAWRQAKSQDAPLYVLRQPPSNAQRREIARAGILAAVEGSRFALYAQPLRDLELNQTTRHEILLRVLDDVGRPAPPSTFLELAEHVDEILAVDKWVINNALRLVGEGSQTSHYQVNISGRSLADPLLIEHIRDAVARHGVNPERLTIEITETAAIGNLTIARRFADGVRALGCQLALDDFGTGNTPLSFLTQLPVDLVKIDGSFVQDLPRSKALQAVVEGLVQTCHRLGILTAAEYVQDDATLDLLRGYGVDFAQGYHVGEPELIVAGRRTAPSIELELFPAQERAAR
jgi:PAS domain S-box-containing protein